MAADIISLSETEFEALSSDQLRSHLFYRLECPGNRTQRNARRKQLARAKGAWVCNYCGLVCFVDPPKTRCSCCNTASSQPKHRKKNLQTKKKYRQWRSYSGASKNMKRRDDSNSGSLRSKILEGERARHQLERDARELLGMEPANPISTGSTFMDGIIQIGMDLFGLPGLRAAFSNKMSDQDQEEDDNSVCDMDMDMETETYVEDIAEPASRPIVPFGRTVFTQRKAEQPDQHCHVMIMGGSGSGKTFAGRWLAEEMARAYQYTNLYYITREASFK